MADDEIDNADDAALSPPEATVASPPSRLTPQQQRLAIIGGAIAAVLLLVTVIVAGGSDDEQSLTPGSSTTEVDGSTTSEPADATSTTGADTSTTAPSDTSAPATGGVQPPPGPVDPATNGAAAPLLRIPGSGGAFNGDGSAILVSPPPAGGSVTLVDSATGATIRQFGDSDVRAWFSPDFTKVVTTQSYPEALTLWPVGGGSGVTIAHPNLSFEFSPDGSRLLGWDQNMIGTWDTVTGEELSRLDLPYFATVSISPDGTQALTSVSHYAANSDPQQWMLATGEEVRTYAGDSTVASFSPDGAHILSYGPATEPALWNAATGEQVQTYTGAGIEVAAWFSPDGRYVLAADFMGGTAAVFDTITGTRRVSFSGLFAYHPQPFAIFSPDGSMFITYAQDGTLTGWDSDSATAISTFRPPAGLVSGNGVANYGSVVFSADGHKLAATLPGAPGRPQLVTVVWSADTGEQILQVADLTGPRFSPDGTRLAGVSGDGNFISVYAV